MRLISPAARRVLTALGLIFGLRSQDSRGKSPILTGFPASRAAYVGSPGLSPGERVALASAVSVSGALLGV